MNLNGDWEFRVERERGGHAEPPPMDQPLGDTITVPFLPGMPHAGAMPGGPVAACWYRRTFAIPSHWRGQRILLHVGAADHATWVFLDGRHVGMHVGGYTPFTVELTDAIRDARRSTVTLYVESAPDLTDTHAREQPGGQPGRMPGIWQTVWLEAVPAMFVAGARFTPRLQPPGILVEAHVGGATPRPGARLRLQAHVDQRIVGEVDIPVKGHQIHGFLPVSEVHPWSPHTPFLYDLTLKLQDDEGRTVDLLQSYFGLRTVGLRGRVLEMNGCPVFQRLVMDPGSYPGGGPTAPSDESFRRDIQRARDCGFNGALLHGRVFDPRYLYWCDRLGFMVWGETPDWDLDVREADQMAAFIQAWVEQLERDFNHPSLVGWAPFNERRGGQDAEVRQQIHALTGALDQMRPVIDSASVPALHDEFVPGYRGAAEGLLRKHAVSGFCYSQLYDADGSTNGLYTCERSPKVDPAVLKGINEQPAVIEEQPPMALVTAAEESPGLVVALLTSSEVSIQPGGGKR